MENQDNQRQAKKEETTQEQNKNWVEERKSKRAKKTKVRKHQKSIEGKVQREAINEVEDILVRTAFSALL